MFLSIESGSENNGNDQNRESNSDTDNRLDHGWLYSCKAVTNIMVCLPPETERRYRNARP